MPDGSLLSLPIPDASSTIKYRDVVIDNQELGFKNLGALVEQLTQGKIKSNHGVHLDPDIVKSQLKRSRSWRPLFGQMGAAQAHLKNNDVGSGDIFLFFGLFRKVNLSNNRLIWDKSTPAKHVLWGWFQIDQVFHLNDKLAHLPSWTRYHCHYAHPAAANNTLYTATSTLELLGHKMNIPGAGLFTHFHSNLQLTANNAKRVTDWRLPKWFFPKNGITPLTYHKDLSRWQRDKQLTRLSAVARGQEFVMDTEYYPEARYWLKALIDQHADKTF